LGQYAAHGARLASFMRLIRSLFKGFAALFPRFSGDLRDVWAKWLSSLAWAGSVA